MSQAQAIAIINAACARIEEETANGQVNDNARAYDACVFNEIRASLSKEESTLEYFTNGYREEYTLPDGSKIILMEDCGDKSWSINLDKWIDPAPKSIRIGLVDMSVKALGEEIKSHTDAGPYEACHWCEENKTLEYVVFDESWLTTANPSPATMAITRANGIDSSWITDAPSTIGEGGIIKVDLSGLGIVLTTELQEALDGDSIVKSWDAKLPDVDDCQSDGEYSPHYCEFRLQIFNGHRDTCMASQKDSTWYSLNTGDSSYDSDHRGSWGNGSLRYGATLEECTELARELLNEALDQWSESVHSAECDEQLVKDITDAFRDLDETDARDIASIGDPDVQLEVFNKYTDGHGVESVGVCRHTLRDDSCYSDTCGFTCSYVNHGDTYTSTLIHDDTTGQSMVATWDDWLERHEEQVVKDLLIGARDSGSSVPELTDADSAETEDSDKFDICTAYWFFAQNFHGGQSSEEYSYLGKLDAMGFNPGRMLESRGFNENIAYFADEMPGVLTIVVGLIDKHYPDYFKSDESINVSVSEESNVPVE